MARFHAISAISEALAGLIRDGCPPLVFPRVDDVSIYQARSFEETRTTDGFSVFLMRVGINSNVRNTRFRRAPDDRRFRPSLPVDLHYVITPWAQDAATQHRMLGWVMRMLEDLGTLSASHLNHYALTLIRFDPPCAKKIDPSHDLS